MDKNIAILYVIVFLDLFAAGLVVPLINHHVSDLGGSQFILGLMGSFYSGLQLFSGPLLGGLSDIRGRKPVLILTLLCCSVAYFSFGYVTSIVFLLILRMILGIFKHTQTLSKAFVTDVVRPDAHSDVHGKMGAICGAGITLGPLVGGHIVEDNPENGFSIACTIAALTFILNAGLTYTIETKKEDAKQLKKKSMNKNISYHQIALDNWNKTIQELKDVNWKEYWDVFLLKGIVGFSMSIFYSNYSPLLKTYYKLSPKWIGYTISFQGVIGSVCSFFIKYINHTFYKHDTDYTSRNLHSFLLLTITFFGLLICRQWIFFAALLIPLATSNAILRLITLEIVINKSPHNQRGSLIGASNSVRSISGIIGPFVAGSMTELLGVEYVLIVSLLSATVGTIIAFNNKQSKNTGKIAQKKIN